MTAPAPAERAAWEAEGQKVAAQLHDVAAAVVMGRNPLRAAQVAVGIAREAAATRQVVLADLVGDLDPLYALAGGEDALGLTDCFRDELPLNDIARRALTDDRIFVLPAGTPPVATAEVLTHERWPKLVRGFTEAGALLLLVAAVDAPGVEALVAAAQGVIAVDTPPAAVRRFPVLATVGAPPAPPAPPPRAARGRPSGARRVATVIGMVLLVGALAAAGWLAWRRYGATHRSAPPVAAAAAPPSAAPAAPPPVADTIRLGDPVNASDSANASAFAIEVVAANTVSGANSQIRDGVVSGAFPVPTVSPVMLGGRSVWYKAIVGAWPTRMGADSLLATLRTKGVVRAGAGLVVRVPFALLLADGVSRDSADVLVRQWTARGVGAYALVQDDGRVRVFAGAFATPSEAAPLAASVRDAGAAPVMAIRTGRAY